MSFVRRMVTLVAWLALLAPAALAAPPQTPSLLSLKAGDATMTVPIRIILLLSLLTLLPALIASVTPFLRITIVLHFLRQALGTQTVPSNQVLLGLALFLAILVMQPVLGNIYQDAWVPFEKGEKSDVEALTAAGKPLSGFLLRFAREKDIQLFLEMSHTPAPHTPQDLDLKILIPAYILSEMKAGFQIGAVLFLPFLIIDLVVASVTLSIGMVQLPPVMVSAPFKILLFVLVDGWSLLVGSLVKSFYS